MSNEKWWFGFRQTTPKPPGQAVACGPFDSYEIAKSERERSKAWDCEVSVPYASISKEEAEKKAKQIMQGS